MYNGLYFEVVLILRWMVGDTSADIKLPLLYVISDYWGGWACFTVSILAIGILTAVIGDLASSFGCTVGLRDSVTAITFVALGTSLPGEKETDLVAGFSSRNMQTFWLATSFKITMFTNGPKTKWREKY